MVFPCSTFKSNCFPMVGLGVMVMHGGDWQRGERFRVVELALGWSATLKNPRLDLPKSA